MAGRSRSWVSWLALFLSIAGCRSNTLLDLGMMSAARVPTPAEPPLTFGGYLLLAGDLHTHILPPDASWHVSRELSDTLRIATSEHLDFVVLTPHVPARFYLRPDKAEWVRETQKILRANVAALPASNVMFVPGMEYTDHIHGHVGLAFADVEKVLDELSLPELRARPELFFERWKAHGGLTTINHPTLRPIEHAPIPDLRTDMSWRGYPAAGDVRPPWITPEVRWLSENATSIETHNLSVGHLRDQYFFHDVDWTIRESTHLLEREARLQHRPITAVGGSDSHGHWLRPTTWVLAKERSLSGVREAIVAGRTCVRGPEACSLGVSGDDGRWGVVGASIVSLDDGHGGHSIRVRVSRSDETTYFVNGTARAPSADGVIAMSGACSTLHAIVGASVSSPVYVDCSWATRDAMRSTPEAN